MTAQTPLASELRLIEGARGLVYRLAAAPDIRVLTGDDMTTALVGRFEAGSFVTLARALSDHVAAAEANGWIRAEAKQGFKIYTLTACGEARSAAAPRRDLVSALLAKGSISDAEAHAADRIAADYAVALADPATVPRLTLETLDTVRHVMTPGGRVEAAIRYLADPDLVAILTRVVLLQEPLALAERRAGLSPGSGLPVLRIALRLIERAVYK